MELNKRKNEKIKKSKLFKRNKLILEGRNLFISMKAILKAYLDSGRLFIAIAINLLSCIHINSDFFSSGVLFSNACLFWALP
jgi:hypothetical protein